MRRGHQLTRQWHLLQRFDRPSGVAVEEAARGLETPAGKLAPRRRLPMRVPQATTAHAQARR